ncbi:MAG: PKD domain-containing protein, partial [Planctomycetota bacterium]
DGVSSNPFYDPANPRSPESRTWALGLRNPFRAALVPGTGQTDPAAGDPGTLMIGDVGYTQWEDLHVVDEPGMNLGWPLFEGITPLSAYQNARTANLDAPNPLGCASYFDFQDLLKQEQADHNPAFPNPCSPSVTIAPGTPTFMHRRPDIAWRHGSRSPKTYVPIFNGNQAAEAVLGSSGSPVAGTPFNGNCAVGGVLHSGRGMPAPYAGAYYVADYDKDWIRAFVYDSSGPQMALQEVLDFATPDGPVFVGEDPADGSLLYITIRRGEVRRIRYAGGVNQAPEPALVADTAHGATPLTVAFDGSTSLDPEGRPLSFAWDFGDGATSNQPSPRHTYRASVGGTAPTARVVTLTVTDDAGQSRTAVRVIGVNNTPPTVDITSPIAGSTYSTAATTLLSLNASVSDAEDPTSALGYVWEVFLHHNSHFHPDAISLNPSTTKVITPTPCSGEFYAYRVRLTVTDTVGQKGVDEVWLYPDCSSSATASVTLTTAGSVYPGQSVPLTASPAGAFDTVSFYDGATFLGEVQAAPFQLTWTPDQPGPASLSALVRALDGSSAASSGAIVDVLAPTREYARVTASDQDAEEKLSNGYMRVTNPDLELTIDRGFQQLIGLRLPVDVPPGSHISDAYVQFHVDEVDSAPTNLTIRAEATGTPAPITSARADLSSRPKTAARVDWAPGPWAYERAAGARQRTPNLAPIVQELVDRPDWSNPGTILLLIEGVGDRVAEAFDGVPSRSPELVIKYGGGINGPPVVNAGPDFLTPLGAAATVAGTATDDGLPAGVLNVTWTQEAGPGTAALGDPTATTTTVTFDVAGTYTLRLTADDGELQASDDVVVTVSPASVQTLDLQITAGSEDAEERIDTGYMVVSNVDLELGQDRSRPHVLGLRFALGVDPGATITTAWLQFTADEVGTGLCSVAIAAEATDDAPPIASRKRDLSSRPTTASSVPWEPLAWTTVGAAGAAERSPDLRDVLQEVVARPGWQRGNHVILLIRGTGTRTAESVEGSAPRAPVLHVEFL